VSALIAAVAAVICPRPQCRRHVQLPFSAGLGEARLTCPGCGTTFLSGDALPVDGGRTR